MFLHDDEDFKDWLVLNIPPEILTMYHMTYLRNKEHFKPELDIISEDEIREFEEYLKTKHKSS